MDNENIYESEDVISGAYVSQTTLIFLNDLGRVSDTTLIIE